MPRKKGSKEDPVVQTGLTITFLSLIFAIAFASPNRKNSLCSLSIRLPMLEKDL